MYTQKDYHIYYVSLVHQEARGSMQIPRNPFQVKLTYPLISLFSYITTPARPNQFANVVNVAEFTTLHADQMTVQFYSVSRFVFLMKMKILTHLRKSR